jgi:hypothetical protein
LNANIEIERRSTTSLLIKNVETLITFRREINYEVVQLKRYVYNNDIIFNVDHYIQDYDTIQILLYNVSEMYNINSRQLTAHFGLSVQGDLRLKYITEISYMMNEDEYDEYLIEERNKNIDSILK